ncbi:MAG: MFS transporter [Anaerolineae bacterium]|nr:MFS transporter [Anaerolineae bacterium]
MMFSRPTPHTQRRPWRILLPLGLAISLSLFGDLTLYAVLPSQRHTVGLSLSAVGLMLGVNRLIRVWSNPVAGLLYDHSGRRRLFLLGMFLGMLSTLGYGLVTGPIPFLLLRLMWGIAWSLLNVGGLAIIQDISMQENRGRLNGIYNAWMLTGFTVGPLIGGFLVESTGFRQTMHVYALMTALGGLIAMMALPETHQPATNASKVSSYLIPRQTLSHWERVLRETPHLPFLLLLTFTFQFTGEGVTLSTLSLLVEQHVGNTLSSGLLGVASVGGILAALRSATAAAAGLWAGSVSDRRQSREQAIVVSLLLGLLSFGLLAIAHSLTTLTVAVVLGAVSNGIGVVSLAAALGDTLSPDHRGAGIGLYTTAGDIGSAFGPFVAYAIVTVLPLPWIYGICAIALSVIAFVFSRRAGLSPYGPVSSKQIQRY